MQGRCGLRFEGAWLVPVGGASPCGGGAQMQSRRDLPFEKGPSPLAPWNAGDVYSAFYIRPLPLAIRPSTFDFRPATFTLGLSPYVLRLSPSALLPVPFGLRPSHRPRLAPPPHVEALLTQTSHIPPKCRRRLHYILFSPLASRPSTLAPALDPCPSPFALLLSPSPFGLRPSTFALCPAPCMLHPSPFNLRRWPLTFTQAMPILHLSPASIWVSPSLPN